MIPCQHKVLVGVFWFKDGKLVRLDTDKKEEKKERKNHE